MRVATAPISWGACEIPGWGDLLPYGRVLDEMAEAGYAGTELGPPGFLPRDAAELAGALSARALALVGAFLPITAHRTADRETTLENARGTIELLASLGAGALVLAEAGDASRASVAGRVPADGSASFDSEDWSRFCDAVETIARAALDRGLVTAFHPHVGSYVEAPHEVERLLAGTDPALVGICLDTGHIAYGGGDPLALVRAHEARVRHVHLKDLRREVHASAIARGITFGDAVGEGVFAPLGAGSLDIAGTIGELRAAGYEGWLVVEQDVRLGVTPGADPLSDAQRSRELVRRAIGA